MQKKKKGYSLLCMCLSDTASVHSEICTHGRQVETSYHTCLPLTNVCVRGKWTRFFLDVKTGWSFRGYRSFFCVFLLKRLYTFYGKTEAVCVSLASDSSEFLLKSSSSNLARWLPQTWGAYMHYARVNYIDLDLHSRSHQNQENKKGLIISETIQTIPIKFAVKIVRLKVYMTLASLMTFIQGHKCISNVTTFWLAISRTISYYVQTWHDGTLILLKMPSIYIHVYTHVHLMTLI